MKEIMSERRPKVVREIKQTIFEQREIQGYKQIRVAAYCRVSTKQEEQLNSYETQKNHYTEIIRANPDWKFAGIYADKGITGTSVKKRDNFNRMIRACKQGKIDMIIVKSISRFARNTVDCLHYTRLLKELGVDVFFEEQGIHSKQNGSEFYITIYGSIAQSESENISANVKWGKAQSAKEGKAAFYYKRFLGYKKGDDGNPEIDEEQAETVRFIYNRFLAGDSIITIANKLEQMKILTPAGKEKWSCSTIRSILSNERYKGDVIINKTFTVDCISKKTKVNNGERAKYYVENNHPAIIDSEIFGRVQEELARRAGKKKVKQIGTKTEQGKYSSKYALTDLLICGECKTPYRRCTWTAGGKKRIVWRCINRLDFGKKYCHNSPSVEEERLQEAIMKALMSVSQQNTNVLPSLKLHIGMAIGGENTEDKSFEIKIRLAKIEAEIKTMISAVSADTIESFDEIKVQELMREKMSLQQQLNLYGDVQKKKEQSKSRLDDIFTILDGLKNYPLTFNDELIRQILDAVIVESKEKIKVIFKGGLDVEQSL